MEIQQRLVFEKNYQRFSLKILSQALHNIIETKYSNYKVYINILDSFKNVLNKDVTSRQKVLFY